MTGVLVQDGFDSARAIVRDRCWALGMPTLACDAAGAPAAGGGEPLDPVVEAFVRSPFLGGLLRGAAKRWGDEDLPAPSELFDGFWALPIAETQRRRRIGYLVAFALQPAALTAEQLDAACQSAALDSAAVRAALAPLAIYDRAGVRAAARMATWCHHDRMELAVGEETLCGFSRQLTEAYEEITLLQKLGRSMNELAQPEKFVRLACDELHATLSFRWIAARFVQDASAARHMAGRTIVSGEAPGGARAMVPMLDAVLAALKPPTPLVLAPGGGDHPALARLRSGLVAQPVMRAGVLVGALVAGDKIGDETTILAPDMKLMDAGSQLMTILLENAALYEDQQSMFLGTLEALTASIDAKDRYTCGHSERVAHLAMRLAAEIGMDADQVERVRIAGLVHDVGKIGVPEAVLCKPGRLTEEEFELIKAHPEIGRRILADIPQLEDVLPAVMHHHERWDGRGYPHGLAGEHIPLHARLIALADSFDAMSSTRTYRPALPREQVLREIRKCAGTQFDPTLAPTFATLDFRDYDALVARHVERERRIAQGRAA